MNADRPARNPGHQPEPGKNHAISKEKQPQLPGCSPSRSRLWFFDAITPQRCNNRTGMMAAEPRYPFRASQLYHEMRPKSRASSCSRFSVKVLCSPPAGFCPYTTSSVGSISTTCPADPPRGIIEPQQGDRRTSWDAKLNIPSVAEVVA